MKYKVLTWDEFREVCRIDACNWIHSGYKFGEVTAEDILNEYPSDYFGEYDDFQETDDLSSCFTPDDFAQKTLEYMENMEEIDNV